VKYLFAERKLRPVMPSSVAAAVVEVLEVERATGASVTSGPWAPV
jgi:hypothetical protein